MTLHQCFRGVLLVALAPVAIADRAPVLNQILVPHDYYYREMYLPQLTSGPASPSWSPDGESLVYSMQGSLWRQRIDATRAVQLTAGPGYDYQPDWAPDGRGVVFVRYLNDAMELQLLDLETLTVTPLTRAGDVNVDPRFSPDGSRIAFVSTRGSGRFHVEIGELAGDGFASERLIPERRSKIERYYYSEYDHELSPSWSPDGRALIYVGNRDIPYGTGAIWRHPLTRDAEPVLLRREETTWKARPDWSPDGRRIVYASYLGRQWHQLWVTGVGGTAEPFPLTYGDFDATSPRWSPDGARLAYVANEPGDTEIRIQDIVGGRMTALEITGRVHATPVGRLRLAVTDDDGRPLPARIAIVAADGRSYAPERRWMHADDGFDRNEARFETHYFHTDGADTLTLPSGSAEITVWHGLEHRIERRRIDVVEDETAELVVSPRRLQLPAGWQRLVSGDVHVHMNYGGTYRNTPERLVRQAMAEDLDVVFNLIVNKEQRIPDVASFSPDPDPASNDRVLLLHAQEFHTSYWGHVGLLGLDEHLLVPDYSAYPYTAAASLFPDNATVAGLARDQQAVIGYVHPFITAPDPARDSALTHALPVDVALGNVDYYEVVGFADHRATAEVWYRLLNCGFRIGAGAGTDAMANYASLRGPLGVNRVYVDVDYDGRGAGARRDGWLDGLKAGRSIATNGPLLGFSVAAHGPGDELTLGPGGHDLEYRGWLRSIVPVEHLEVVWNGAVVDSIELTGARGRAEFAGRLRIEESGWLLLRGWSDAAHPDVFDLYPYATTSPVYVSVDGKAVRSTSDADYFIAWIERIRASAAAHPDYNSAAERETVLSNIERARRVYETRRSALSEH